MTKTHKKPKLLNSFTRFIKYDNRCTNRSTKNSNCFLKTAK